MAFDTRLASDATGAEAYGRVVGIAGAAQASASLVLYPITTQGRVPALSFPTSRSLTLTDMGSLLEFTSAGTIIATLPSFATLGWTRNSSNPLELCFAVIRIGTGPMQVTPAGGVTIQDPDGLAASNRLQYQGPVMYQTYGNDLWFVS